MDNTFLTIQEVSQYLHIKPATLYAKVEAGELPHYKVGRLVRFRKQDVDSWMEDHRRDPAEVNKRARAILKTTRKPDVEAIVKKSIEFVKDSVYSPGQGIRPNQASGKEVRDGIV